MSRFADSKRRATTWFLARRRTFAWLLAISTVAFGFWRVETNFHQDCEASNVITQEQLPKAMEDVLGELLIKYTEPSPEVEAAFRRDLDQALRDTFPPRECDWVAFP